MPRRSQRRHHRLVAAAATLTALAAVLAGAASPAGAVGPGTGVPVVRAAPAAAATSPSEPASCAAAGTGGSGVSCTFSDGISKVQVDQTAGLINQTVNVSWSGLPESALVADRTKSTNAVAVLQCWGDQPVREHCWPFGNYLAGFDHFSASDDPEEVDPYKSWRSAAGDSEGSGISPPFVTADGEVFGGPDPTSGANTGLGVTLAPDYRLLPANEVVGRTDADGNGAASFEVRTKDELPSLGCDDTHPCSLVVIPVVHDLRDEGSFPEAGPWFGLQLSGTNWNRRAVIPLAFAPQSAACSTGGAASLQVVASEVAENALRRWQPKVCSPTGGATPVDAAVTVLPDRLTREAIGTPTGGDLAVVNQAVPAATGGVTYAPLVGAGVVLAFNITNVNTGRPFPEFRVSPRLLAKLLTQSYCGYVCGDAVQYPVPDPNVAGNYSSVMDDPELFQLNPSFKDADGNLLISNTAFPPEVAFSDSDVFFRLTQWIDADPAARAWLDGKSDGALGGPHIAVNKKFTGWELPISGPEKRDDYTLARDNPGAPFAGYNYLDLTYQFAPNLRAVSQNVLLGWSSATTTPVLDPLDATKITGFKRQSVDDLATGSSSTFVLGIMSSAQASTFGLRTAAVPAGDGTFVAADAAGLTAGVKAMAKDPATGLWSLPAKITDPAAYPLTVVEHAVARNRGLTAEAAAGAAAFVRYAASTGQVVGTDIGQLPGGYVGVTPAMAAQSLAAAEVYGKAATPVSTPRPTPSPTPTRTPTPRPTPTVSPAPASPQPTASTAAPLPAVDATPPSPATPGNGDAGAAGSGDATDGDAGGGGGGSAGSTTDGSTGQTGSGSGTGSTDAGGNTGGTPGAGSAAPGTTGSTAPGGGSAPAGPASAPTAGPAPAAAAPGVAAVAGAAPAAQPLRTADDPAGSLRWALLALLVIGLAAGVAAPVLAGTGRGARLLASAKKRFGR